MIPFIKITARREREEKIRAIEVGADDFISNPFNKLEVRQIAAVGQRARWTYTDTGHA